MTEERKPEEPEEQVEDLDVPPDEVEKLTGGTRHTLMKGCATGEHIKKADIRV